MCRSNSCSYHRTKGRSKDRNILHGSNLSSKNLTPLDYSINQTQFYFLSNQNFKISDRDVMQMANEINLEKTEETENQQN